MKYIQENKAKFGVEPICKVLQFAPQTYYAAVSRAASVRARHDEHVKEAIEVTWYCNRRVYGAEKVWKKLRKDNVPVARCTVERLMRDLGLRGKLRGRGVRTTFGVTDDLPDDLVDRKFIATAPNQLWVADLTYVKTHSGWVYVAFIIDVYSRRVVGWQASTSLRTDLALNALDMALWARRGQDLAALVHHSDRGVQYRAVRYTERLEESGLHASVGSKGDSYDNALAESFNGLYKAEMVWNDGPWFGIEDVEHATMEYVDWFNNERLHGAIGTVPPAEFEEAFWAARRPEDAAPVTSDAAFILTPVSDVRTLSGSTP